LKLGRETAEDPPLIGSGGFLKILPSFQELTSFLAAEIPRSSGEIMSKLALSSSPGDARLMELGFAACARLLGPKEEKQLAEGGLVETWPEY
jgi:hypothetical protein